MRAGAVHYAIQNWTRHLPNKGITSGVAVFSDDDQALSRIWMSAATLRKSEMSVSGDYGTHMYNVQEGFPPPAPFCFSHSATINVGGFVCSIAVSKNG